MSLVIPPHPHFLEVMTVPRRIDPRMEKEVIDLSRVIFAEHKLNAEALALCNRLIGQDLGKVLSKVTHIDLFRADVRFLPWVVSRCAPVRSLKILDCYNMSDKILCEIAKIGQCSLRTFAFRDQIMGNLDLPKEDSVTLKGFTAIAKTQPNIRKLILCGRQIDWFDEIGILCKNLQKLDLGGCDLLEDEDLRRLAEACKNLVELSLEGCHLLTDQGMDVHFPRLTTLNVFGCFGLTAKGIELVKKRNPQLRFLGTS